MPLPFFHLRILCAIIISIVIMGSFVYFRDRRSSTHRAFAALTLSITIWILSLYISDLHLSYSAALLWNRIVMAAGALMGMTIFHFSMVFPERKVWLPPWYKFGNFFIGFLFILATLFTDSVVKEIQYFNWGINIASGYLFIPLLIWALSIVGATFINFGIKFFKFQGIRKTQLLYLFVGFFFFLGIMMITNLILPAITGMNPLAKFGPYFVVFLVGFTAYAIIKHRLMDIRLVIARSVVYSLLVLAIGAIYISIIFFLKRGYETLLHIDRDTLFIIAGFAVAFGFQPLRRFLQKYTDKIFFKGIYDPQQLLGKLGKIMSSTLKLEDLLNSMLKVIVSEVRIGKAAFFVLTSSGDITHVKTIRYRRIPNSSWGKATKLIKDTEIIVADELPEESKEKDILRELEIAVLVPLQVEGNLIGVLILGEKRSGDMFTIQDLRFLEILAPEVAVAIKNAELFEEKEKRILELSALNKLAFSLGAELDLKDILNQAIDQALLVTGADSGSIMLLDEETQTLTIKAARGIELEFQRKTRLKVGQGIAGWVAKASEPLIITDSENERFKRFLRRDEIISALSVPLKAKEKVIGVLSVNRKTSKEPFTEENLNLISSFAAQVAVAIENARLYKDLEMTFLGTISALAAAVDAKDHYTFGHSQAVTKYAVAIAKKLSLPESEIESIRIASMLHDIGKIGLDGTILNKPGKLTPEERALVNLHPLMGVNILKSLEFLKSTIPLILYHHEHFDGMGYPEGIAGKAIPLGARIIAVADAFNAMISERPYRRALSIEEAIEELRNYSGTQFDPTVVEAFLKILRRESRKPLKVQQS